MKFESTLKEAIKYFVHGAAFSLIFIAVLVAWTIGAIGLVSLSSIVGLVTAFVLLPLVTGFANGIITTRLWFSVRSDLWSTIAQGLILLAALFFVNISLMIPMLTFPGPATTVVFFVIQAFLDGVTGKAVASIWEKG